ncbi:MAG: hypothetical protein KTR35_21620 [Gammaproteobacteria bacterium]|nr:hypothetical protein [Gammaproteobacteria bacterium]
MEGILIGLENWSVAEYFRNARWGYALLNAIHIFGVSLLIGATVLMNMRLLGFWSSVRRSDVIKIGMPIAVIGLSLTILAGLLLFSVRAQEYAALGMFQIKLILVFTGTVSAILLHWRFGRVLDGLTQRRRICHALLSLFCWPGALLFGRLIAFADS